jgi:hypothetical protein
MAVAASTVWMVHRATGPLGVRGELLLERERLIFRPDLVGTPPELLGETIFAGEHIRKVARSKHSPVLELRVSIPGLPEVVLFYFVKPPDRYSSGLPNPRIAVAAYLANSNLVYTEEVDAWVRAIKEELAPSDR